MKKRKRGFSVLTEISTAFSTSVCQVTFCCAKQLTLNVINKSVRNFSFFFWFKLLVIYSIPCIHFFILGEINTRINPATIAAIPTPPKTPLNLSNASTGERLS